MNNVNQQQTDYTSATSTHPQGDASKKWYTLRTLSKREATVKEYINAMISTDAKFAKYVSQTLIPMEQFSTTRNGKTVVKHRPLYTGYVFVEAELIGDIQHALRNVPNVLGFLNDANTHPIPLTSQETKQLIGIVSSIQDTPTPLTPPFKHSDSVKITDGPFLGFNAIVEDVNNSKKRLRVSVTIFGQKSPLELDFSQVKKN